MIGLVHVVLVMAVHLAVGFAGLASVFKTHECAWKSNSN